MIMSGFGTGFGIKSTHDLETGGRRRGLRPFDPNGLPVLAPVWLVGQADWAAVADLMIVMAFVIGIATNAITIMVA